MGMYGIDSMTSCDVMYGVEVSTADDIIRQLSAADQLLTATDNGFR
jgi:hypothetical protein